MNTADKKLCAAGNAFMRILLQTGPFSEGSVLFDDLSLRPFSAPEPANLLAGGDFERNGENGMPYGLTGAKEQLTLDYDHFNTGYGSLRLTAAAAGETGFEFEPIPVEKLKAGQQLACSLFFQGDRQMKGMVVVELLDAAGNPLARRLGQMEFEAVPGRWQATSFTFTHTLQKEEEPLVKAVQVRVAANMVAGSSLWFDTFVMR